MAKKNNGSTNHNGVKKTKKTIDPKHTTTAGTITAPKQPPHTATVFHLTGHVTERGGGQGLAGLRVEAVDKDLKYEQPLGNAHTDDQGRYEITFNADRIGKAEKGGPDIVIRVFDKNGAALGVSDLFRNAGTEVTIDLPVVPKETATIREIATALHLHLPAALITGLAEHGIRTLGDIRSAGGLSRIEGLTVAPEDPALQIVEAHAQLNLLPSDLAVNAMLIERGYTSLADMANVSRQTFVASLGSSLEVSGAEALHAAATAQTRFLENTIAAFRVNTSDRAEAKYSAVIEEVMPPTCGCENCKSATSPMAYLADLLDYALRHLKHNGAAVTLTFLQDRFHQPFRDLPATCEQMEKKVRQVRICIEVLRQHLPAPDATLTSHWYLETAYATLLQKIGTSFDEIRQMCSVRDPKTREAFAAHLGIILDAQRSLPNHPDELDRLFLDTDFKSPAFPVWPRKLSEQELEQLFGLRDTKRPALDPDVIPEVLIWRMHYLRLSWHEADRSATPPLGEYPIIDPDIVGYSDLKDTTPAPTPRSPSDKPSWRALDFLEDRQQWVATKMTYLEQSRKNFEQSRKNSGLTKKQ